MSPVKVLVQNEKPQALIATISQLANEGFEVSGVASLSEALTRFRVDNYDLLILNLQPPGGTGEGAREPTTLVLMQSSEAERPLALIAPFAARILTLDDRPESLRYAIAQAEILRQEIEAGVLSPVVKMGQAVVNKVSAARILPGLIEGLGKATAAAQVWVLVPQEQGLAVAHSWVANGADVLSPPMPRLSQRVAEKKEAIFIQNPRNAEPELQQELVATGITSAFAIPLMLAGKLTGVASFVRTGENPHFSQYEFQLAATFSSTLALALENSNLLHQVEKERAIAAQYRPELERRQQEIRALNALLQKQQERLIELEEKKPVVEDRSLPILRSLVNFIETGDPAKSGHSDVAAYWIVSLAESMGLPSEGLAEAAYLHDLGMFLPRNIFSQDSLNTQEQQQLLHHPNLGKALAEILGLPDSIKLAIQHHHENYDGSGYPDRLAGDEIPLPARLLRVVDSYSEMISPGPGKEALSPKDALAKIKAGSGREYDPQVVKAFLKLMGGKETRPEVTETPEIETISTLSHELRSPLTFLMGYSELLAQQEGLPPDAREQAKEIHQEALHMSKLVDDLLNISRHETGRAELKLEEVNLSELIRRAVTKATTNTSRHQIETYLPPQPLKARVDPDKVLQVLDNLLTNAINYSPEGGKIIVTGENLGNEIRIGVSDQGIGIPKDKLELIFQKFYRVDSPLKHKVPGTGLGLSLCRYIVEAHGGRIWAESEEGKGSTFYFTIPTRSNP